MKYAVSSLIVTFFTTAEAMATQRICMKMQIPELPEDLLNEKIQDEGSNQHFNTLFGLFLSTVEFGSHFLKSFLGISLVVQWLRIHLPMQGTVVQSLIWEAPTCHMPTKAMHHNY